MADFQSDRGSVPQVQNPAPSPPFVRSPARSRPQTSSALSSLSAEPSKVSEGEENSLIEPGPANVPSEGSGDERSKGTEDIETYREERSDLSTLHSLRSNPRHHTRLGPGALGDQRSGSSITLQRGSSRGQTPRPISRQSASSIAQTIGTIQRQNPGEALRDVRRKLAGLEEERELVMLTRKLSEIEAEKAAGFPTIRISPEIETSNETVIQKQILQESKLAVPFAKAYSGQTYAHYQSYIRACEHVFDTRPTTYRKEADRVLYGIGALEGTASITWYRYAEIHGRLSISWGGFKKFLLDDLLPPSIRLRDVYKRYREAKQQPGQTVHGLVQYLEELEAQMVPVTEDHQMSTILGALHPWIEAQVSSQLESPKTKSELIQLALKVEFTAAFQGNSSGTKVARSQATRTEGSNLGKGGKRVRSEMDSDGGGTSAPSAFRIRKDDSTTGGRPTRDLSRVKCYNCGQLGHIFTSCTQPPKDPRMPLSGKA